MELKSKDICIILGYFITEYQVFDGKDIVNTYFNIRDNLGKVYGRDFNNIEEPLKLLLSLEDQLVQQIHLDETTHNIKLLSERLSEEMN